MKIFLLCSLQERGRLEQQRGDRRPAGLAIVFDVRAERADLVVDVERGDALIRAALGCRRMLERAAGGHDNHARLHAALHRQRGRRFGADHELLAWRPASAVPPTRPSVWVAVP